MSRALKLLHSAVTKPVVGSVQHTQIFTTAVLCILNMQVELAAVVQRMA